MSSGIRNVIQQKIAQTLGDKSASTVSEISANLYVKGDGNSFAFFLPLRTKNYDIQNEAENISRNAGDVPSEISVNASSVPMLAFHFSRDSLVKKVLENNAKNLSPPRIFPDGRRVVVEFSSPNIAKPFHVGHLRSTIIGNYLANLHSFLNDRTTKINYLGDWGTQFGYIQLGIDMLDISQEAMTSDPISQLYTAYVHANKLSENDAELSKKAREIFESLERGDEKILRRWELLREYTTEELRKTYGRLGVSFDEYHWESMYNSRDVRPIIQRLESLKLMKNDEENRKVIAVNEKLDVPVIKSDGTTLYLMRDIAAAIDRYQKYKFDVMYYVVANAQSGHFANLLAILDKVDATLARKVRHVKFGKIRGMSTRKGTAVFLSDFLNEARDAMREKQTKSSTTKVSLDSQDNSSDVLGISAIVIHDLKQKRQKDYDFNWNVALDIKGETGVKLQYSHCRLVNLEENCGISIPTECDPSFLREPIVNDLVTKIIQFDEAIIFSYRTLEPCYLAKYLFELSHIINKTFGELRVKGEPNDVASQRLLLYRASRNVLAEGMKLLGLRPLEKM